MASKMAAKSLECPFSIHRRQVILMFNPMLWGQRNALRMFKLQWHDYTLCLKKVPIFKLSVTSSNLNRFSKLLQFWKRMKFATKPIRQYPPQLRNVATLPWGIKKSNFLQIFSRYGKCKQIAFLSFLTLLFNLNFWYQKVL